MNREQHEQFDRFDPARPVDLAWRRAVEIAKQGRRVSSKCDSVDVIEAERYLRRLRRCKEEASRDRVRLRWPDLAQAHELVEAGGTRLWEVQARLLAGQNDAEIADCCGLTPGAVFWFEKLFFHVRDRLEAGDWISVRAIGISASPLWLESPDLGTIWRVLGYFAGVHVLELAMAVSLGRSLPDWVDAIEKAGRQNFAERCRLSCRYLLDAVILPPGTDLVTLSRLLEEAIRYEASCRRRRACSIAERVAAVIAETELHPPVVGRLRARA